MNTSSKIPATDRSTGGPGSSHVNRDKDHEDKAGAHHQNKAAEHKHPNEQKSTGGGTKHEKREPGEGGRS